MRKIPILFLISVMLCVPMIQILTELYPLIGVYADMVAADPSIPPDRETEDKILALINRLLVK
jgi:hypothetical protein